MVDSVYLDACRPGEGGENCAGKQELNVQLIPRSG